MMRRSVFLSTFLFAAALSPVLLQSNTCTPAGNAKLAVLELRVGSATGENMIKNFSPNVIVYQALMPASVGTAVLRAQPQDSSATIEVRHDGQLVPFIFDGYTTLSVPLGLSELTIKVSVNTSSATPYYWTYVVSIRRGDLCEGVACDDHNECTEDMCNPLTGVCDSTPVEDGSPCAEGTGTCEISTCHRPYIGFTGNEEEVIGVGQWGLYCIPDEHVSYYKTNDIYHLWPGVAHHFTSPDFNTWTPVNIVDGNSVPALTPSGEGFDRDYAGPGSVIRASNGQDLLMFYHGEYQWPEGGYYATIGVARSSDEGQTWERLGPAIEGRLPLPDPPPWYGAFGAGGPSAFVDESDGFIYLYYVDWSAPAYYPSGTIHVARAPISSDGLPGSWRKYFQGDFDQDGLGGNSEHVIDGWFPSVGFNVSLNAYLAVFVSEDGFYYSTSSDRIHWTVGRKLLARQERPETGEPWLLYPSLLSPSQPTDSTTNATGYLYYGRGIYNVECHHMVRRPVRVLWDVGFCDGVDCDDQNACTDDACDFADGSCSHTPVDCSDSNDCTVDTCDPTTGCEQAVAANGTACAGGSGTCQDGSCAATFPCTEQGILDAIAFGGGPHTFDCTAPTTVITTAEIVIDNDVILDGQGQLTVHGNQTHRVFSVNTGTTAELIGLTVTGGQHPWQGGGIANNGTLTLASTSVSGNQADGGGGGIFNGGTMTLNDATVANNTAVLGGGGGIHNEASLTVTDSTVSGNTGATEAGGLLNRPDGTATLIRSTVEGNNSSEGSGGGIANSGTITLIDTSVRGNQVRWHGGGIFQNGSMLLINTAVSGNIATYGGGLRSYGGSVTLTNSTVSNNVATDAGGGGLVNDGTMTLISTTLAENSAAQMGTAIWNQGTLSLRNAIVAGDCDIVATLTSLGGNIESEGNTCGLGHPTDLVFVPALLLNLGPLADNGGPTMTHALGAGSVAIDQVPEADCVDADGQPLTTDQRGLPRPETGGTMCDVGAFEVQP
jgi:hypothetical protein